MKKLAIAILLTCCLFSLTRTGSASGAATILHIRDDGSGGDCGLIGEWDESTKTCTLTADLTEIIIYIDFPGATLDGAQHSLFVTDPNYFFIAVVNSYQSNTVFKNLRILGGPGQGVGAYGDYNQVLNCTIENVGQAIAGGAYATISGNLLLNNQGDVNAGGWNVIENNIVQSSTRIGGLVAWGTHHNIFRNNIISGHHKGIWIRESNDNLFENNIFYDNGGVVNNQLGAAVLLEFSSNNTFLSNEFYNNGPVLLTADTTNNIYEGNYFHNNASDVISGGSLRIANNIIRDNAGSAASITQAGTEVYGNWFENNAVYVAYGSGILFHDNTFMDSQLVVANTTTLTAWHNNFLSGLENPAWVYWYGEGEAVESIAFSTLSGGNYWSAYDAPDEGCYDTDTNGFCDNAYLVPHATQYLPLDKLPYSRTNGWLDNQAPEISLISAPTSPVQVNLPVNIDVSYLDADEGDTHTVFWNWGDGTTSTSTACPPTASIDHIYTTPGVYTLTVTIRDASGAEVAGTFQYIVAFDPNGGFITGGGWIVSPPGAYLPNPDLSGKATFGFVSRYQKGALLPTGNTEFQFKAAGLHFSSTDYDWLVVAGSKAQYKGWGMVNGTAGYRFLLTAVDSAPDRLRIKIWNQASEEVIYDNNLSLPEGANPVTVLEGGSITIHK